MASAVGGLRALNHPHFRNLWTGLMVSNAGSWMQHVAQGWLVLELSGSPFYLGLVGFVRAVPLLALSLFGGAMADRFDRRRILLATQSLMGLSSLLLALLTALDWIRVWHVVVLAGVNGLANAFDQPCRNAMIPALVPKADLTSAISLNAIAFSGAAVFGPSLAGVVVPLAGLAGCFFINAISYVAILLAVLRLPAFPARTDRAAAGIWTELKAGLAYVRRSPILIALVTLLAGFSLLVRPYQQFLPVFARDVLHIDIARLGLLTSAPGVGVIAFSLAQATWGYRLGKGRVLVAAALTYTLFLGLFAWNTSFPLGMALLSVVGGCSALFMTTVNGLMQENVSEEMRGRVMSLYTMLGLAIMPLGQMPFGLAVTHWGAPLATSTAAVLAALAVCAAVARVPAVLRQR